jgi:phosphoesterase RecJ-like protein
MTYRFTASPSAREAIRFIQAAQKIYITAHVKPDGDAIGSALGFYWALTQLGKQARVMCPDPIPDSFGFLPGCEVFKSRKPEADELICVLDSSDLGRIEGLYDERLFQNRPVLNIDHHVTNVQFGTVNWIEPKAASTAEIIYELSLALGAQLEPNSATCLLTGIATDTLAFRVSGTTPELMEVAAQLMRAGASLPTIIEYTFNTRELTDLRLQGKLLASMQVEDGLVWADNTLQIRKDAGARENGGGGMGTTLLSGKTSKISVIFIERAPNEVEVSFRSRVGYDVAQIAAQLGGGGHPQASGCTLNCPLEEAHRRVLPAVRLAARRSSLATKA